MSGQKMSDAIPVKRISVTHPSQLPSNYSTTPGGTLFSTTPGGTRIIYERNFILNCRNSPIAHSPPPDMAHIPGLTFPNGDSRIYPPPKQDLVNDTNSPKSDALNGKNAVHKDEDAFEMDI